MSPTAQLERARDIAGEPISRGDSRQPPISKLRRRHPWRRRIVVLLLVLLTPVAWSYGHALTAAGSAGWQMRTIEWLREHGAGGTVDNLEVWYYTRHHPPTSGLPSGPIQALPTAQQAALVAQERATGLLPHLDPAIRPQLRGEAAWRPGPLGPSGHPAIYTTWFRPDRHHPTVVAGMLWIDPSATQLHLVAGTKDPGGGPWPGTSQVERRDRSRTLAAFNSGFLMSGAHGGFYQDGRRVGRLRTGQASMVIMKNGRATVGAWGRDVRFSPNVEAVRQNLALIVEHGRAVRGLKRNTHFTWGSRKSQLEYVWRSGIGVDQRGHLMYIGGNNFTLTTLAAAFVQAHAVRAMELDIHFDMVTANLFTPAPSNSNGVTAGKLLPGMPRPATRYLQPDQRDFFTNTLR